MEVEKGNSFCSYNLAILYFRSLLSCLRFFFNICLVILPIVDLVALLVNQGYVSGSPATIVADVVKALTYFLSILLQLYIKKHGLVTSGTLLFFWLATAVAGIMPFRYFLIQESG